MVKHGVLSVILIAMCSSLAPRSPALEANTKINYQGRLINGTNLVNGTVTNVFRLYNTGGTLLYAETQSVTVVDGLYSARIGEYQPAFYNALTNLLVYLEVQVNGVILSPREQLFSAPYAVNAVKRSGDTMTGPLSIEAGVGSNLVITSKGTDISVGDSANGGTLGVAVGSQANGSDHAAAIGFSANGAGYGVAAGNAAHGEYNGAAVGSQAIGSGYGAALGFSSDGGSTGVAAGAYAEGYMSGAAVGAYGNGAWYGAAVGKYANAYQNGAALGASANGFNAGVAVGRNANGSEAGVAVGNSAIATDVGVAIGNSACGSGTNIAIGFSAAAGVGPERIAIGHSVVTPYDNAAAVRGTLYLDGGSNVYFRTNFGSGAWTVLSGGSAESATGFVRRTGDTMTGMLSISNASVRVIKDEMRVAALRHMLMIGGGDDVEIGNGANAYNTGAALGANANGYNYGAALGVNANGQDHGVAIGSQATGHTFGVAIGADSIATNRGTAVGEFSGGSDYGAAVGYDANGVSYGVAIGNGTGGRDYGVAVGQGASGYNYGSAIGSGAAATDHGAALGNGASGAGYSVAVGYGSYGYGNSVALGNTAKAYNSNVAIGAFACAANDYNIIAIGEYVTNDRPNTARMRGTLYLDGATSILYRTSFGAGPWSNLLSTAEVDPKWTAASNGMQTQIDSKLSSNTWATANSTTNYVKRTGDSMSGPLTVTTNVLFNYAADRGLGAFSMLTIGGGSCLEIGVSANGYMLGTAIGASANGYNMGAALGNGANGAYGAAIGYQANGMQGAAVGRNANGGNGVALGEQSYAYGNYRTAIGINASNTVDNSALIRGTLYLDGATNILVRTNFGSGAWAPYAGGGTYVEKAGDTMSGALTITTTDGLVIASASNTIAIGHGPTAMDSDAIAIGQNTRAYNQSAAVGSTASAVTGSVAVGYNAESSVGGVALGSSAEALLRGVAIGQQAAGSTNGVAIGYGTDANPDGVAVGYQAQATPFGVAVGSSAKGTNTGIAIGYQAAGAQTNVSIGVRSSALGSERIAIGHYATNNVDNSALVRGNLYLDGATNVMVRTTFGTGSWSNLIHGVTETVTVVTNVVQQKSGGNVTNIVLQTDNWIFWNGLRIQ